MSTYVEQVGGTHYAGTVQHWDLMEEYDVSYLEAQASRYLSRWRKKGGLEDLEKALTFLRKMDGRAVRRRVPREALWVWFEAAGVHPVDREPIKYILQEDYGSAPFLLLAEEAVKDIIAGLEGKA